MANRLPPPHSMIAFEAVARYNSVTKAAEELCVSHSAISHQIRQLQDWLGVKLLERKGRGVGLTETGNYYAQVIHSAFDAIRHETERLSIRGQRPVTISAIPIMATQWLIPRLERFSTTYPDITIQVVYAYPEQKVAINTNLAILFGQDHSQGWKAEPLAPGTLIPVCSPPYLKKKGPFQSPSDLMRATLIHDEDQRMWRSWFNKAGLDFTYNKQGVGFYLEDSSLMLSAALSGQGVALVRLALVKRELEKKQLVQVLPQTLDNEEGYFLFYNQGDDLSTNIIRVRDWILQEADELVDGR